MKYPRPLHYVYFSSDTANEAQLYNFNIITS